MYFTYVLKSIKDGKYYIGSTEDIERRLDQHNSGLNKSTKNRTPFELIYKKEFASRTDAIKYEYLLKKQKGGIGFEKLIMPR